MTNHHDSDGREEETMLEIGPDDSGADERATSELPTIAGRDFALGCGGVLAVLLGMATLLVGGLLVWQASDEKAMSEAFLERGERVEVVVVDRDVTTQASGSTRGPGGQRVRNYWLEVRPAPVSTGEAESATRIEVTGRLAVSRAEHDEARIGGGMTVWRLGDRYELERIIEQPLGSTAGRVVLGVGTVLATAGVVVVVLVVRRVRAGA